MAARLVHLGFVLDGPIASFIEKTCADEGFCHRKGVTVGRGVMVFPVTLLLADSPGNVGASSRVGHAGRKVIEVGGFVESS